MARGRNGRRSTAYKNFEPHGQPCHYGCGRPATTRDHQPALALHEHIEGSGCCRLLPACNPCNSFHGQLITASLNRKRARKIRAAKRQRYGAFVRRPSINGG